MKISQMKNVVPLERKKEVSEVEWKKAKEIADYLESQDLHYLN